MRELVEFMAKGLVEKPDDVRVEEVGRRVLELQVDDDDLGRVIGRRGRTAQAMRAILNASDGGRGVSLEIGEA